MIQHNLQRRKRSNQCMDDAPVCDTAWGRGHDAAMRGDPLDSCPYSYDSPAEIEAAAEWQSGWNDATHGG